MKKNILFRILLPPPLRWVLMFAWLLSSTVGWAQTMPVLSKKNPLLDFRGQVGIYTDLFASSNQVLSERLMTRPPFAQRLVFDAGINLWKFRVPIKFNLGLPAGGVSFGQIPKPSLGQYLVMPRNGVGMQPQYKSLKVFLGTHTPTLSRLTGGNIPILTGAGVQWDPWGVLHLKASYGITQAAVDRDSLSRHLGSYKREMLMAQVGFGRPKESHIYLNYVRARDDTSGFTFSSLKRPFRRPVDGGVFALDLLVKLSKRLTIQLETAVSAFSKDRGADTLPTSLLPPSAIIWFDRVAQFLPLNTATKLGLAADARVAYKVKNWDAGIKGTLYSPGYQTLSIWNQQDDRLDLTADLRARYFKNRLTFNASGGIRMNNLLNSKVEGAYQEIYSANATLLLFKYLNLTANFSNFGLRTTYLDDSPIQRQLNQSIGLSPSISFGKRVVHVASLNISLDDFSDKLDTLPGNALESGSKTLGYFHSVTLPGDLGIQVSYNAFNNTSPVGNYSLWNASAGLQKGFLKNKLQVSAQLQLSDAQNDPTKAGSLFGLTAAAKYKLSSKLNSVLNVNVREQNIAGTPVQLWMIRNSVQYTF